VSLLLDTDVLIDLALDREPFADSAAALLDILEQRPGFGWIVLAHRLEPLLPSSRETRGLPLLADPGREPGRRAGTVSWLGVLGLRSAVDLRRRRDRPMRSSGNRQGLTDDHPPPSFGKPLEELRKSGCRSIPVAQHGTDGGSRRPLWYRRAMTEPSERITVDPEQCGDRPGIRGMRIRVSDVIDLLARANGRSLCDRRSGRRSARMGRSPE